MLTTSLSLPAGSAHCLSYRPKFARSRTQPWSRVSGRQITCDSFVGDYRDSQEYKDENPGFDDVILDETYFAKMGIDLKQFTKDIASSVSDIDPEGMNLTPEMFAELSDSGNADFVREQAEGVDIWGPEAVILAGFKSEESAMIRGALDLANAVQIKVLPCTQDMLHMPLVQALEEEELDWSLSRPKNLPQGREWGSQRAVLISGMSGEDAAAVVQVLEDTGLPPLCVALARKVDEEEPLGKVLTEAVKGQRNSKVLRREVWNDPEHVVSQLPDLQELIGEQARQRLKFLQQQGETDPLEEDDEPDMSSFGPDEFRRAAAGESDLMSENLPDHLKPLSASELNGDGDDDDDQQELIAPGQELWTPEVGSDTVAEYDEGDDDNAADDEEDEEEEDEPQINVDVDSEDEDVYEMDITSVMDTLKRMRQNNMDSDEEEDELEDFPDNDYPADVQQRLMEDSYEQLFGKSTSSTPRLTPQQVDAMLQRRTVTAGADALRRYKTELKQSLKQASPQQAASGRTQHDSTPIAQQQHSQNGSADAQAQTGSAASTAATARGSGSAALAEARILLDDIVAATAGGQQGAQVPQEAPKEPQAEVQSQPKPQMQAASQSQVQATLSQLSAQAAQHRQQQQEKKERLAQQKQHKLEQQQKRQLEQQQRQEAQLQAASAANETGQSAVVNGKSKKPIGHAYLASQTSVKNTLKQLSLAAQYTKPQEARIATPQSGQPSTSLSKTLGLANMNGAAKSPQPQNGLQQTGKGFAPRPARGLRLSRSAAKQAKEQKVMRKVTKFRATAFEAQRQQLQKREAERAKQRKQRRAEQGLGGIDLDVPDYELDPKTGDVKWRVVRQDFMTAEQMHKDMKGAEDRPAWSSPSGQAPAPTEIDDVAEELRPLEVDPDKTSESRTMNRKELRAFAAKRGVDINRLLEDVKARGITISD